MSEIELPIAIAYPLDVGRRLIGLGRTRSWAEAASGALRTYLCGRRRMVTHQSLLDYVAAREAATEREDNTDEESVKEKA
jgi:hypothetical protein